MSQSAGPGSPSWFMCAACRRRRGSGREHEGIRPPVDVVLTGKTKRYPYQYGSALGVRSSLISRQYECQRCGHVGWSTHKDLQRAALTNDPPAPHQ